MISQPVVVVEDVSVTFEVAASAERVLWGGRAPVRSEVHALRGVNLELYAGESVGIVGHNGAGKSTLMRAIAGLLPVTSGTIMVKSQPQLLGVQAALLGKLSGYKNIELGLLASEVRPDEVVDLAKQVAEFTQLGASLNYPVRTYSNGMRSRLAFGIAAAQVPEVLLLDEALAVGDREFKQRSLDRMREICGKAGAILMATHNLNEIASTCSRCIWLQGGEIIEAGDADEVIATYRAGRAKS